MTAIYPSHLPAFSLRDGYGEQPRMERNSFQPDSGTPIERPKGTVALTDLSISAHMTSEQVETFSRFVFDDLGQACLDFMMTHPRRKTQARMRIKDRPPYRLSEVTADLWLVEMTVTVIGG